MSEKETGHTKQQNARKARLAAELRANLLKRKAQAKKRRAESKPQPDEIKDD